MRGRAYSKGIRGSTVLLHTRAPWLEWQGLGKLQTAAIRHSLQNYLNILTSTAIYLFVMVEHQPL